MVKQLIKQYLPSNILDAYHFAYDYVKWVYYERKLSGKQYNKMHILLDDKMVEYIMKNHTSLSRFGDGEFRWMLNIHHVSFEEYSDTLANRLREVLTSNEDKLLVAIPRIFNDISYCTYKVKMFWRSFMGKHYDKIYPYLDPNKIYGDTELTRPYIDYKDKSDSLPRFQSAKKLWDNRNVVIIEGEKTKLGVGNDLFTNVSSICRIVCPASNAFQEYKKILDIALRQDKNKLILIALGPTATILAYDLCKYGYQALDIGHIDIEYEWYLSKTKKKIPVMGKIIRESGTDYCDLSLDGNLEYQKSIIARVKHNKDAL